MLYSLRGVSGPKYALLVTQFDNGGASYRLERREYPNPPRVVLAFCVTRQGWLIGDGRDMQTARRAQTLTANWT